MSRQAERQLHAIQSRIGPSASLALLCLGIPTEVRCRAARPQRPGRHAAAARLGRHHQAEEPRSAPPGPAPARRSAGAPPAPPGPPVETQAADRHGRRLRDSTSIATKTNTPIINIPQSVDVLTRASSDDQAFQTLTDALRYVPGVIPHQGEGNRDDVVIRGSDPSADFFVNGFRDDVQYFRDLYNVQRIEVLKGPNAMIFGRGGGGGVINRVLKEADWHPRCAR